MTAVTKSRTAIVVLVLGTLYILMRSKSKLTKYLLVAIAVVGIWKGWELIPVLVRWEYTTSDSEKVMFSNRGELWQDAINNILRNPVIGTGICLRRNPHNWYLDTMQRAGIIGMLCYLAICAVAFVKSFKSSSKSYWPQAILYMGFLQAFAESRLLNYGQFSSVMLMLVILMFVTESNSQNDSTVWRSKIRPLQST